MSCAICGKDYPSVLMNGIFCCKCHDQSISDFKEGQEEALRIYLDIFLTNVGRFSQA